MYDSVLLLHIPSDGAIDFITSAPNEVDLVSEGPEFVCAACPFHEGISVDANNFVDFTCSFSTDDSFYHSYVFFYGEKCYEVVIQTHKHFAFLFLEFLETYKEVFRVQNKIDPYLRFTAIANLLFTWPDDMHAFYFPDGVRHIESNVYHFEYGGFNPLKYFSIEEIEGLWQCLFTNKPVLIVGKTADFVIRACFSAFALLEPLVFVEKSILWLLPNDPRYSLLTDGCEEYKLVGTPCSSLESLGQFTVFHPKLRDAPSKVPKKYQRLMTKYESSLKCLQMEANAMLLLDPYSDFVLRKEIDRKHFRALYKIFKQPMPTKDDLLTFFMTDTYRYWRTITRDREEFRSTLLGFDPESIPHGRSPENLRVIIQGIDELLQKHQKDQHLTAVLRANRQHCVTALQSIDCL